MTIESDLQQDHVGALVRRWRERRRLSQQALSDRCGVSTRHLSYIETGKSVPSPTMISQLGDALEVPLRVQRRMFTAAGFVPGASELPLDSPALAQVNEAIELTVRFRSGDVLSFLTTTTVFGTPWDVTVAELAIEALYPADAATRDQLVAAETAARASR